MPYNTRVISLILFFILLLPYTYATSGEYFNEFNETGEICTVNSTWSYLNNDLKNREIVVYNCCNKISCLTLPFDENNRIVLTDNETVNFFRAISLREYILEKGISSDLYNLPSSDAITCYFFSINDVKRESKNAVLELGVKEFAPKIFPKAEATIIAKVYTLGKYLRLVEETNIPVLVISTLCTGGEYAETLVISSMKNCGLLVDNLKGNKIYEDIANDTIECNNNIMNILQIAKYTPSVFFEKCEDKLKGLFSETNQTIVWDVYDTKISTLSSLYSAYDNSNENILELSNKTVERFQKKKEEAQIMFDDYNGSVEQLKEELDAKISSVWWKNFLYEPNYNYDGIKKHLIADDSDIQSHFQILISESKFNSGISLITNSTNNLFQLRVDMENEDLNSRNFDLRILFYGLALLIIFLVGYIFYNKFKSLKY